MQTNEQLKPTVFAIFGGGGDLTWRKLVPALFDLYEDRSMPARLSIISVDRVKFSDEELRRRLHDGVNKFSRKLHYRLKIIVASNEGRELNAYRIRKFKLNGFVDFFISSCFVHLQKPDADIFRLAPDISQAPVRQVVYIENTPMFVWIAEGLGIRSICHTDYKSTCVKLASFGLEVEE